MRFIRILFSITSILVLCFTSKAQDNASHQIDSLKHIYYANPNNTNGVSAAYQLAKSYDHTESFDSALHYANLGIAAARKLELNDMLASLLRTLGNINNAKGD